MKKSQLVKIIKEEIQSALQEAEAALYTDWKEHVNPDYIVVHLKDGRKLQISKKHIAGGTKVYQAILQAFGDERTDITNKIVGAMSAMLGGTLKKESALQEANENPASNMLSLLAAPDFKKYMDRLSDMVDDNDFMAIKGLYDKLYNELKKHEGLQEGYGSVKPIKTFKVTALAKIFKSLGFPVKKVEAYNNINAGPTLSIEFVNTLKDENEFIDAYHDFQYTGGVGRMLPNIESAYHKGGNKWDFQTEA